MTPDEGNDIAVIGVGLRFPGDATSPSNLWSVLERKQSQWSEFPKDRLNIDGYYHPSGDRQGSISFRGAHFLAGDMGVFDAPFFQVTAEDAKAIDPQQRLLLEVSYEALENAGIRKEDINGSDTAVYVGSFVKDYEQICLRDPDWQPQYAATGNGIAIMANRISYFFNLHGPSVTIDTGCSGSLVGVHLAAQSLRTGECSMAIAAGAGMILTPNTIMPMTALNFLSPDGKCFAFDARANGYGRGEGVGAVILKRMADAIRDNDTIRAVIRGSKVNQDGRTTGITLPSKEAQVANIRSVYQSAGLSFEQTAYVECHGTGTQAGDTRETQAIAETLALSRPRDRPIFVGSVKTNIGHLEGAAGIAGLIKGVLMLEKGQIPPNINFETGNPNIDFDGWKIKVPTTMTEWPIPGVRRVSVNCFGFGGTNAHVIVDEAPAYLSSRGLGPRNTDTALLQLNGSNHQVAPAHSDDSPRLFCYSAHERSGVERILESHLPYLESRRDVCTTDFLSNYSYTLGCRRSNMSWRCAVVASSVPELLSKIGSMDLDAVTRTSRDNQPKICFLFCGQGAQWAEMGKDLMVFQPFRKSLEQAALYMKLVLGSPFDLLEELFKSPSESRISEPAIAQPATSALQIALIDLLDTFGIISTHVVGHSSGEIAAAFAAGALSREAAWEVAYFRGFAAASIPVRAPKLEGGMMAVGMTLTEAESYLQDAGTSVQIACVNSPRSITLSGQADALQLIANDLQEKKVFCRFLAVRTAYHSSHMKLVENDYRDGLGQLRPNKISPFVGMFSSVTGERVIGSELGAEYWCQNLVSPVQYLAAVQTMMSLPADERPNIFMELSPNAALRSPTTDILSNMGLDSQATYLSILNRQTDGPTSLLKAAGDLWLRGCQINMNEVLMRGSHQTPPQTLVDLPPFPWNHERSYWHESHLNESTRFRKYARQDLIGARTADSVPFEPRWRGFLRISESPWIQDHQVQKTIIYPAAGMVSMVLEGVSQMAADADNLLGYEITNMWIEKAMLVPNTAHGLEVALNIRELTDMTDQESTSKKYEFAIYSKALDKAWERHASGGLRFRYKVGNYQAAFGSYRERHAALKSTCNDAMDPRQLYESLDAVGMNYGSLFQNITSISKANGCCVSQVRVPDTKSKMPVKFEYPHLLHPATLDAMFQTLFAIDLQPMVPTFIKSIFVSANIGDANQNGFTGYATANRVGIKDAEGVIVMSRPDLADSFVAVEGLHFTGLSTTPLSQMKFLPNHHNMCTEIIWKESVEFAPFASLLEHITLLRHKYPGLAVLQVGGDAKATDAILHAIAPDLNETIRLSRYTIAGCSATGSVSGAPDQFRGTALEPFVEVRPLDALDSFGTYHLIISFDDNGTDKEVLKKHLKVGARLVEQSLESGGRQPSNGDKLFNGITSATELLPSSMDHIDDQHKDGLRSCGITASVEMGPITSKTLPTTWPEVIVLASDSFEAETRDFIDSIEHLFDPAVKISSMVASQVLENSVSLSGKVVISLLDFSNTGARDSSMYDWTEPDFKTFHALQKSAKGILWLTRGAHMKPGNPHGSPVIALARTIMSEDPLKTIVTFDLASGTRLSELNILENVVTIYHKTFVMNTCSGPLETEYAEEAGNIFIPRLRPLGPLNQLIEDDDHNAGSAPFSKEGDNYGLEGMVTKVVVSNPGLEKGSMSYANVEGQTLGPDDVEIIFTEASLTHLDLDTAMGRTTERTLGMDVRGQVARLGSNVTSFQVDDDVVAMASGGAISNTTVVNSELVRKYEAGLIPSQVVTAYYSVIQVGRAGPGRRVLVHAGASAFGISAVRLAVLVGCEVFATVLGPESDLQCQILEKLGLPEDHILDANTDEYVALLNNATEGNGVEMLFNPTQEHVETNFKCVRKGGTIVQLASKSPTPRSLGMPMSAITMVNLDLSQLLEGDESFVAELFESGLHLMRNRSATFAPDPKAAGVSELSNIESGLKQIEKSPYLGYVSVGGGFDKATGLTTATRATLKSLDEALDLNGTYVLVGGLGGLGRSIANMLIDNGVRHLAFLSRSGASSDQAKDFLKSLGNRDVDAQAFRVDICDEAALAQVVDQITTDMPAVRGIFQCAAVIKDAVFDNMSYTDWMTAFRPKAVGSWNIVQTTTAAGHDPFYIFLASSAGVIGNRGQANYAAGNCFEDALARHLRIQGKHAVSIDLGPVLGAGMLADDAGTMAILRASGFYGIKESDFLKVVRHAITMEIVPGVHMPPQVILGIGTGGIILQNQPADPYWARTALYSYLNLVDMPPPDLSLTEAPTDQDAKAVLARCTDVAAAAKIVCGGLTSVLAKLLNMLPEEMDADKSPTAYGVDSLVAVGVRNTVFGNFGVEISVFDVLSERTVAELALLIAEKGGFGVEK